MWQGKPWHGRRHLPFVRFHNNHLAGEQFALKFNVNASDAGVTPEGLGELIYENPSNASDLCNGKTIRQIMVHVDSALTFWKRHTPDYFVELDSCLTRINNAFTGLMEAENLRPMRITGVRSVADVSFLRPNPFKTAPVVPPADFPDDGLPTQYMLYQNYPNPFNPTTMVSFVLGRTSLVTLKVYNILGQEVATVLENEEMDEGEQEVVFSGENLTSGMYFYRLVAREFSDEETENEGRTFVSVRKMMLMK